MKLLNLFFNLFKRKRYKVLKTTCGIIAVIGSFYTMEQAVQFACRHRENNWNKKLSFDENNDYSIIKI